MRAENYIVTLKAKDSIHSELWASEEPLHLGYQLPWKMEWREGHVFLIHESGQSVQVDQELISKGKWNRLPSIGGSSFSEFKFQVREAAVLGEAFDSKKTSKGAWYVSSKIGHWILESGNLKSPYAASSGSSPAFSLNQGSDGSFELTPNVERLEWNGKPVSGKMKLTSEELAGGVITVGSQSWNFCQVEAASKIESTEPWGKLDSETFRYYRFLGTSLACSLFMFFSVSTVMKWTKKFEVEAPPQQQFAKVVVTKIAKPKEVQAEQAAPAVTQEAPVVDPATATNAPQAKPLPKTPNTPAPAVAQVTPAQATQQSMEPTKPQVNAKVLQAQNFANSMNKLLKGASRSTDIAAATAVQQQKQNVQEFFKSSVKSLSAPAPKIDFAQKQEVKVTTQPRLNKEGGYEVSTEKVDPKVEVKGASFVKPQVYYEEPTMVSVEGLSREEVKSVIDRHASEVKYCYDRAVNRRPASEGKIIVKFVIGSTGAVKSLGVKTSTVQDPEMESCILDRLGQWRFPKPRGSSDVEITSYAFEFRRL